MSEPLILLKTIGPTNLIKEFRKNKLQKLKRIIENLLMLFLLPHGRQDVITLIHQNL